MDERHSTPIKTLIAEYLMGLAAWRRGRYDDDLRDKRNLTSSEGIVALAEYVRSLPDEDERLTQLDRMWRHGEQIEVRQQAAYEMGRFRFFNPTAELDAFLDDMVELALKDDVERAHFGGKQVQGDDPFN
jgi:hypothetical protein